MLNSPPCWSGARRARGLTLIELLVAIAVITLLVSLLVPSLAGARTAGRSVVELSAVSQLGKTHAAYAGDFKEAVIPCRINKWWIWWQICDTDMFPPDPEDPTVRMTREAMRPWTWRLIGYSPQNVAGSYILNKTDWAEFRARGSAGRTVSAGMASYTDATYVGAIATHPSFGMNGVFFGGDNNHCAFTNLGRAACSHTSLLPESNTRNNGGLFYVTRVNRVQFPSTLITWAASRGADVSGTGFHGNGQTPADGPRVRDGFYKVLPPANVPFSSSADHQENGSASLRPGWTAAAANDRYNAALPPSTYGYLNARYFGTVATTCLDGSAQRLKLSQLRDMKRWDNFAVSNTNPQTGQYTWRGR